MLLWAFGTPFGEAAEPDLLDAVAMLEQEAVRRELLTTEAATQRFDDALFSFMVGKHEAAAEQLWAIRTFLPPGIIRQEADYILGQCLANIGATALAMRIHAEILGEPNHPFAREVAVAQIDLYAVHRSASEFATLYQDLSARGLLDAATGALAYALGRAHWRLGHLDEAEERFAEVDEREAAYDRARYHRAVIAVKRGDLALAIDRFTQLRDAPLTELNIAELSTLALARIAFEQGEFGRAASLYRSFSPDSPLHGVALEELVWTEVQRGDGTAAATVLRERLQRQAAEIASPKLQATLGRLHLKLGEAASAEQELQRAIETFEDLIEEIRTTHRDPGLAAALFDEEEVRWTLGQLRADDRVMRAAGALEIGQHADAGIRDALTLTRLLERRLLADPSTTRDRRLLASAAGMLLTIAERRLEWALEACRGRARALRTTVEASLGDLRSTRATLDRTKALPTELGTQETARLLTASQTAVKAVQGLADRSPPAALDEAEGRLRQLVRQVRAQVQARNGPVQQRLASERQDLQRIEFESRTTLGRSEGLWNRARALGAEAVLAQVDDQLQAARAGLADASFERLVQLRDATEEVTDAQTKALAELEALFDVVRERHPD
ncbi:MAG: hypothetical protein AAGA48_31870 [Myxococcota bacterium]